MAAAEEDSVLNINVGMLGHVDSGKTSIVAALSSTLSTAALDKHPQSRARGITLDLGFSAFTVAPPLPPGHACEGLGSKSLQFTLVDCPGHASLIRTVIGGARIIDVMVLVVDAAKGLQAQTLECLAVGEMAARDLVVALNKTDALQAPTPEARAHAVKKAGKLLAGALAATRFAGARVVPVAARPAGGGPPEGIEELRAALVALATPRPADAPGAPLLFAVDHCFALRGQGTVLTGTVLQGCVAVGDSIELPALKQTRAVRSIQMFKRPAKQARAGDRAGLLVPGLDAGLMERGLATAPGAAWECAGVIAAVEKVRFYAGAVPGRARYHVSVGHDTAMAEAIFFGAPDDDVDASGGGETQDDALARMVAALEQMSLRAPPAERFDWAREYAWQAELYGLEGRPRARTALDGSGGGDGGAYEGGEGGEGCAAHFGPQWALLKFDRPVIMPPHASVIGSRLDLDAAPPPPPQQQQQQHASGGGGGGDGAGACCRLAFFGRALECLPPPPAGGGGAGGGSKGTSASGGTMLGPEALARLRVSRLKERCGAIERVLPDGGAAIARGLFKRGADVAAFEGARVALARGGRACGGGVIEGRFGGAGKVRIALDPPQGGNDGSISGGNSGGGGGGAQAGDTVVLRYKKYVFEPKGGGPRRVRQ